MVTALCPTCHSGMPQAGHERTENTVPSGNVTKSSLRSREKQEAGLRLHPASPSAVMQVPMASAFALSRPALCCLMLSSSRSALCCLCNNQPCQKGPHEKYDGKFLQLAHIVTV